MGSVRRHRLIRWFCTALSIEGTAAAETHAASDSSGAAVFSGQILLLGESLGVQR